MLARSLHLPFAAAAGCALALAACNGVKVTHVPRGESVEIALARRPDVVRMPTPAPARTAAIHGGNSGPVVPDKTEQVADAFTRGQFSMQTGNQEAAIQAFREAVKIDPKFKDAWANLAALYERSGQDKLALEAFRKSKSTP
jgi:tetratricopeptide (TPR) repeat protein